MAMDPEELVTLTDHGTMKLRSAVVRAMILPAKERKRAKIVREGDSDPDFQADQEPWGKVGRTARIEPAGATTAKALSISWAWPEKPPHSTLTIPAEIHQAAMALPPNERRDRAKAPKPFPHVLTPRPPPP